MRTHSIVLAALALVWTGSLACADFVVTQSTSTTTAFGGPKEVITFLIQNTGTGSTAGTTKLLAVDLHLLAYRPNTPLSSPPDGHLYIHTFDEDGSGINDDADFENLGVANPTASFIRFGGAASWTHVASTPPQNSPDDQVLVKNPTPYTDGQSLPQFEVVGASNITGGGTTDFTPKVIAVAVVDPGEFAVLCGDVGAESGPPVSLGPFCVPEPASFALALVGLGVTLAWRRRIASSPRA